MAPDVVIEAAQEEFSPVELRDLDTKAVKDPGKLRSDVPATDDDDAPGQFVEEEALVRRDGMIPARNVRNVRPASGGDENVRGAETLVVDVHFMGTGEAGVALEDAAAGVLEHVHVDPVQPGDLGRLVVTQRRPVEAGIHG